MHFFYTLTFTVLFCLAGKVWLNMQVKIPFRQKDLEK